MLHSENDMCLSIRDHIRGFHFSEPVGVEGTTSEGFVDQWGGSEGTGAWRGLRLYNVVSSVFITFFKLLSRRKSDGRSRWEKS